MSAVSTRLLSLCVLLAAAMLACWPSVAALGQLWLDFGNPGYTHGLAIAAAFVWLVFRARHDLASPPARPSLLAYFGLLLCVIAWAVFWRASLQALHELLLPVVMWLALCAAYGWVIARRLTVPFALLYFALPTWDVLTPLLQQVTVRMVVALLALTGVPVHVEGTLIYIPEGVFQVIDACAGLNFLVAGLALATLLGEVHSDSVRTRLVLIAVMAVLAVVTNWLRVFVIVFVGHLTNMQHSLVTQGHSTVGWALFAVAAFGFIWLASRLPAAPENPVGFHETARPAFIPGAWIAAAMLLALIPAGIFVANRSSGAPQQAVDLLFPPGKESWRGPAVLRDASWKPAFIGAQGMKQALYRDTQGHEVEAFAVVYLTQRQGAELIRYDNSLFGADLFITQEETIIQSSAGAFRETAVVNTQGDRFLVWSVYTVGARRFVRPLMSQLAYGLGAFAGPLRSGLMAFRAPCGGSCADARLDLERFVNDMGAEFERIRPASASLLFFRGDPS